MAVSSLKWILLMLLLITYISNTSGRGGRGGGGRGGGGRGGGGYGRSSGSRGGGYKGSSISSSGSSSNLGGSSSPSSKVSSSSSGKTSFIPSGNDNQGFAGSQRYNRRYYGSGSRNNNRRYYGSGSSNNEEDKADPAYTAEPFRFPTPKRVTTIKPPYIPFDDPIYKDHKFEMPKFQAPGSGFSRRREPEGNKIYNDFWAKVPDFRLDGKTIKAQDYLNSPPKEWWRAETIPNTRYRRLSDI